MPPRVSIRSGAAAAAFAAAAAAAASRGFGIPACAAWPSARPPAAPSSAPRTAQQPGSSGSRARGGEV
eukprot:359956-Chlamydomonas_euryale.AAC.4